MIERSRFQRLEEPRPVLNNQDRAIFEMYFEKGMTQEEVAKALGISVATINRRFRKYGWKARSLGIKFELDEKEIHRLYFEENLTQEETANRLGISRRTLWKLFRDNKWKIRSRKIHESRAVASLTRGNRFRKRVKELRAQHFGSRCSICGRDRKLAIHRKDGEEHGKDVLWRAGYLNSINPDEWVALCIPCHRGVHWLTEEMQYEWDKIEGLTRNKLQVKKGDYTIEEESLEKNSEDGDVKDIRNELFGNSCELCGVTGIDKMLKIHRKDGKSHSNRLLWSKKYLQRLNPDDWASLCQKCHRYVHWSMDELGLEWNDLKKKEDGAEGEMCSNSGKS